jgi:hypothetical protein
MKKFKQKKKVAIDIQSGKVYDYKSVVAKNPIYIGSYNEQSKLI